MKNLFKEAHKMTREIKGQFPEVDYRGQFGICLSYLLNKEDEEIGLKVKEWFLEKNFSQNEIFAIKTSDPRIIKETEKAVLIDFVSDYGIIRSWIPKSCLMSKEDFKKEEERAERRLKAFEEGQKKYHELIKFAKENKVKGVRVGLRKETLLRKIKSAGLEAPKNLVA